MNTEDLVDRLRTRAYIRRSITTRKSVQENQPDRIAELLDEAAIAIEELTKQIPDWENIRKPNPHVGTLDKEPQPYTVGDIDWTKALK